MSEFSKRYRPHLYFYNKNGDKYVSIMMFVPAGAIPTYPPTIAGGVTTQITLKFDKGGDGATYYNEPIQIDPDSDEVTVVIDCISVDGNSNLQFQMGLAVLPGENNAATHSPHIYMTDFANTSDPVDNHLSILIDKHSTCFESDELSGDNDNRQNKLILKSSCSTNSPFHIVKFPIVLTKGTGILEVEVEKGSSPKKKAKAIQRMSDKHSGDNKD